MPAVPDALSEDTIAAIATAPGRGAVALVRISGARALQVAGALLPSLSTSPLEPRLARLLRVADPRSGEPIDHALVTYFPAPGSFTGEECVEISTHGGFLVPRLVLAAAVEAGGRAALPGEFTRRALANGKIDLLQAEAILDLVNGSSPALHRAAIHQLERGLSGRIQALRSSIIRVEALLSYGIDFPDEDEPPVAPEVIEASAVAALEDVRRILRTAPAAEMLRDGALVVLAGRPNAGKSSLFNALLGFDRSIVTEMPGTTRDAVEAAVNVDGYPLRLVDTAGLRHTEDVAEGMGVEVAHRYLDSADIILYCLDGAAVDGVDDIEPVAESRRATIVAVRTKGDLWQPGGGTEKGSVSVLPVSAQTGEGLAELSRAIVKAAFGALVDDAAEDPLLTRERHVRALRAADRELEDFLAVFRGGAPAEIAATHLQAAAAVMEGLIGVVATDDVLGAIFEEFCVGK